MFQSLMKNDIEVIDRFAQKGVEKETLGNDMQTPVNVLRHAACVPVYEFLKNQIISPDTPEIYLVSGKCFRNEAGNVKELARLNEFFGIYRKMPRNMRRIYRHAPHIAPVSHIRKIRFIPRHKYTLLSVPILCFIRHPTAVS